MKNKGGRPSDITQNLINATEKVLKEYDIVVMNDYELVMFINEELEQYNESISNSSFEKWKAGKLPEKTGNKKLINDFLRLIKKALYFERTNLMKALKKDNQWQRYAWILERKFDEWNLRFKNETDLKVDSGLKITVDNQKQADSINNMLDAIE